MSERHSIAIADFGFPIAIWSPWEVPLRHWQYLVHLAVPIWAHSANPPRQKTPDRAFIKGIFKRKRPIIDLPALQKNFMNIFFVFAWEFCIEKWQGFLVNFFWSPSPTKRSTKSPRKIRGKFGAKSGAKFGTKIRKIRETFVLQLFWPNH